MGKWHMPPNGISIMGPYGQPIYEGCQKLGETYCLTFDDAGIFTYFPLGYFDPELPMGYFKKGDFENGFTPVREGVVTILFIDIETGASYIEEMTISADCAPSSDPCQ
jgi:hypothetical protein